MQQFWRRELTLRSSHRLLHLMKINENMANTKTKAILETEHKHHNKLCLRCRSRCNHPDPRRTKGVAADQQVLDKAWQMDLAQSLWRMSHIREPSPTCLFGPCSLWVLLAAKWSVCRPMLLWPHQPLLLKSDVDHTPKTTSVWDLQRHRTRNHTSGPTL